MANVDTLSDIPGPRTGRRVGGLRIAVIGGGVAGLTAVAALHVRGRPGRVYERRCPGGAAGMGIMLAAGALADLAAAGLDPARSGGCRAVAGRRAAPPAAGRHGDPGAKLAGLRLDPDRTVLEARLPTGEPVRADLYVAADDAHSLVRRIWYADWPQPLARVRELVGIVHCPPGRRLGRPRSPAVG